MVERLSDMQEIGGSSPPVPIRPILLIGRWSHFQCEDTGSSPVGVIKGRSCGHMSHSSNGEDRGLLIPRYGFKSCMRHPGM